MPIKILRVVTRLNIGGPSIHTTLLSTRLNPCRFVTCLVVGEPEAEEGDLSELVRGPQTRVIRVATLRRPIRPWTDLVALVRLLGIVWQERPHILHTHMAKAGALGRLAGLLYNRLGPGRRPGRRAILIHTFHGHVLEAYFPRWLSRLFVTIERWLARRTDCLIAVSPAIQHELSGKGIGRAEQWRVIPLGLDLEGFAQMPLPDGAGPLRCGMIGRLVPIKNPALFLQALARITPHAMGLEGLIVGDGPLRQGLEQDVKRLGLERLVRFTGWQRDVCAVYAGLDVACLTSWNEGTPVSLIEAMAAGRAVVATDVGGIRDVLAGAMDARTPMSPGQFLVASRGILVRPGDLEGFASALQRLASDAPLRRTLGEAGRAYALAHFTHQRLLQDVTALYESLHR